MTPAEAAPSTERLGPPIDNSTAEVFAVEMGKVLFALFWVLIYWETPLREGDTDCIRPIPSPLFPDRSC